MSTVHPAYAQLRRVTDIASVLLENNPGMMTLDGTNTWILHAPGSVECVVVDPGDNDEEHLQRVAGIGPVALTLITHRHYDHTGGVDRFHELTSAPVRSVDPAFLRGGASALVDGEVIEVAGLKLRILATPGHTADSVSIVIENDASVLTGDTILGRGTAVLDDSDGDLGDYLTSLRSLAALGEGLTVLPGHGPRPNAQRNGVPGSVSVSRPVTHFKTDAPTSAKGPSCRRPPWPAKAASSGTCSRVWSVPGVVGSQP